MTLNDYLEENELTEVEFAARIGISQSHCNRLRRGKISPSIELAARIQEATGKAVGVMDLLRLPSERQAADA